MSKLREKSIGRFYHSYPTTVALVTVRSKEKATVMAAAWHTALSYQPPLYGVLISSKRFTYQLVLEAKEFGVNFLPYEKAEIIAGVGRNSTMEVDKFTTFGILLEKPQATTAPIIKDSYAAYECRLVEHRPFGDHTLFVGEIVMVHSQEGAFTPQGVLYLAQVRPALYLGANLYMAPAQEEPVLLPGNLPEKAY